MYIVFLNQIIGSFIATIGSILVWYIIEKLKTRKEYNKLKKSFIKLYYLFAEKDMVIEPNLTYMIIHLIGDIKESKFLNILNLSEIYTLFLPENLDKMFPIYNFTQRMPSNLKWKDETITNYTTQYNYMNKFFSLYIGAGKNYVPEQLCIIKRGIHSKQNVFNYEEQNENTEIKEEFLEYFKEQCDKNRIKINNKKEVKKIE